MPLGWWWLDRSGQGLRKVVALPEDPSSVPNTHVGWLTVNRNFSSREFSTLFWPLWHSITGSLGARKRDPAHVKVGTDSQCHSWPPQEHWSTPHPHVCAPAPVCVRVYTNKRRRLYNTNHKIYQFWFVDFVTESYLHCSPSWDRMTQFVTQAALALAAILLPQFLSAGMKSVDC